MKNKVEIRNMIYQGIKAAVGKLIPSQAKDYEFLIVSKDGNIVKIPAIDIK